MVQRQSSLHWLWYLPALALCIIGLATGLSSHQIVQKNSTSNVASSDIYLQSSANVNYIIAVGEVSGNVYIHPDGSNEYFVAFQRDFTVSQQDIDDSLSLEFVALRDTDLLDPALKASNGETIARAHKIEQLVFYDGNDQKMGTYTTKEYAQYLAGQNSSVTATTPSFVNQWPLGLGLIVASLIWCGCVTVVLFLMKRAAQRRLMSTAASSYVCGPYPYDPYSAYNSPGKQYDVPQTPYYPPYEHFGQPPTQDEHIQFEPPQ